MSSQQKPLPDFDEVSCGGVPFYFEEGSGPLYLLVLHDGPFQYWAFPKGRQNKGESYEETAIREIKEETGQSDFEIIKRLISDSIYFPKRGTKTIIKKVIFYLVRFKSKNITLSPEHAKWRWVTYDEALSLLIFENYKRVLKESHEIITSMI